MKWMELVISDWNSKSCNIEKEIMHVKQKSFSCTIITDGKAVEYNENNLSNSTQISSLQRDIYLYFLTHIMKIKFPRVLCMKLNFFVLCRGVFTVLYYLRLQGVG